MILINLDQNKTVKGLPPWRPTRNKNHNDTSDLNPPHLELNNEIYTIFFFFLTHSFSAATMIFTHHQISKTKLMLESIYGKEWGRIYFTQTRT